MILEVEANSPAERAGLMVGDIILRVGGRILAELGDPRLAFLDLSFGETVQLDLLRGGTPITRNVILDPLADRPAGSKPRPAGPVPRGAAA
jgi:S1-C subfamily serine protease